MQPKLYEHFSSEGHDGFLHDFNITLIDKIDVQTLQNEKRIVINFLNQWFLIG